MGEAVGRLWRRLRVLLRWRQHQAELREEIAQHAALRAAALEAEGLSPVEAAAAANRAMGNATQVREEARVVWSTRLVESVWQDLRYAARSMYRQPVFTAVAVLGLAGGLGFSAAAFSGFNALAFRGWEVHEPDDLIALYATSVGEPGNRRDSGFSLDNLAHFTSRATTITGAFAHERTRPDGTGSLTAAPVSASYFAVLGIPMALGRSFVTGEDRVGAPTAVIVLGHHWWTAQLDSSAAALGRTVRVNGVPFTVIGVAARGFGGTDLNRVDGWIPMSAMPLVQPKSRLARTALAQSDQCCVHVAARLAPGVRREDAARELTALLAQAARPGIDTLVRTVQANPFTMVGSSGPNVTAEVAPIFALIFGGVAVVLLLACANVANLLLARAAAREREIGVRLAIGASRSRLIRQLMTESLLLALVAGLPALAIARWLPTWIMSIFTPDATTLRFAPDARVLGVTFALAVVSCVLFGLAPALHATRPITGQRFRVPLRSVFLSAQVTFCLVLLVAAGLFLRSVGSARTLELGFEMAGVYEIRVDPPANEDEVERAARLAIDLPDVVRRSGARDVAFIEGQPFAIEGARIALSGDLEERHVATLRVSSGYFGVVRQRLIAGRLQADGAAGAQEMMVNARFAETRLGGVSAALGATIMMDSVPRTVVGVLRDARDVGDVREAKEALYRPFDWSVPPRLLVRGNGEEAAALAAAIRERDPSLNVSIREYTWYLENQLSGATGAAAMAGVLGVLALVLASVGIFGVFSFWVRERTRDIGIRMAFGATTGTILRMVLAATGRAVGWGLVLGLVASIAAAMVLRSSLYGLEPLDPVTFGSAIGVMLLSAALATVLPAWRAIRVEPMEALRAE